MTAPGALQEAPQQRPSVPGRRGGPPRQANQEAPAGRRPHLLLHLAFLPVFALMAAYVIAVDWTAPGSRTLGGGSGDAAFFEWSLGWAAHALTNGHNPFVSDHMGYPVGVNLMWNTSMLLVGLVLTPVTLLAGPVVSFNILITSALALSAWSATLVLRRYVPGRFGPLVGGALFGFGPYMVAHSLGHPNLTFVPLVPVLFLLVDDIVARQRRGPVRDGLLLALAVACQLLLSEEILTSTALVCVLIVIVLAVAHRDKVRAHAGYALRALAVTLVATLLVAGLPLYHQFFGSNRITGKVNNIDRFGNDLYEFVVPGRMQRLKNATTVDLTTRSRSNSAERNGYLGIPLLLVATGVAIRWRRRTLVKVAATGMVVMAVMSMGGAVTAGGERLMPGPWALLRQLPVLESLVASRLGLYAAMFAILLLAILVGAMESPAAGEGAAGRRRVWARAGTVLAVVAVAASLFPSRISTQPVTIPAFFTSDAVKRVPAESAVLMAPNPSRHHPLPMLWQSAAGLHYKTQGGYFLRPNANGIGAYESRRFQNQSIIAGFERKVLVPTPELTRSRCQSLLNELRRLEVRTVLIAPMNRQADTVDFYRRLLDRQPEQFGDVYAWFDVVPDQGRCDSLPTS